MNNEKRQLVKLLNAAMKGNKVDVEENIDWNKFLELAKEQKVEALTYSALKYKEKISSDILDKWKKETFFSGIKQVNHIKQISNVLERFNKENIKSIVLKGLVVRDYYPSPQLRTMGDADILVDKKDLERVGEILLEMGYYEYSSSPCHNVYAHRNHLVIEVHWTLADDHFFRNIELFEKEIYSSLEEVSVGDSKALSLGLEDFALNQCIHMAKHMAYKGFGIRHLCDMVVLMDKKEDEINWDSFIKRANKYGIEKFTIAIFVVCNTLFNTNIPKEILDKNNISLKYINQLIEEILDSGVHGKNDLSSLVANELAYDYESQGTDNKSVLSRFIKFLFPPIDNLSHKYNYAKKYKILAPIAWIHHLFAGVFNKEYSVIDKFKFATSALSISKKRNKLIQWLEL